LAAKKAAEEKRERKLTAIKLKVGGYLKASNTLVEIRKILIKLDIDEYIVYEILVEMWDFISDVTITESTMLS
jgi:hypothetical protein